MFLFVVHSSPLQLDDHPCATTRALCFGLNLRTYRSDGVGAIYFFSVSPKCAPVSMLSPAAPPPKPYPLGPNLRP